MKVSAVTVAFCFMLFSVFSMFYSSMLFPSGASLIAFQGIVSVILFTWAFIFIDQDGYFEIDRKDSKTKEGVIVETYSNERRIR